MALTSFSFVHFQHKARSEPAPPPVKIEQELLSDRDNPVEGALHTDHQADVVDYKPKPIPHPVEVEQESLAAHDNPVEGAFHTYHHADVVDDKPSPTSPAVKVGEKPLCMCDDCWSMEPRPCRQTEIVDNEPEPTQQESEQFLRNFMHTEAWTKHFGTSDKLEGLTRGDWLLMPPSSSSGTTAPIPTNCHDKSVTET